MYYVEVARAPLRGPERSFSWRCSPPAAAATSTPSARGRRGRTGRRSGADAAIVADSSVPSSAPTSSIGYATMSDLGGEWDGGSDAAPTLLLDGGVTGGGRSTRRREPGRRRRERQQRLGPVHDVRERQDAGAADHPGQGDDRDSAHARRRRHRRRADPGLVRTRPSSAHRRQLRALRRRTGDDQRLQRDHQESDDRQAEHRRQPSTPSTSKRRTRSGSITATCRRTAPAATPEPLRWPGRHLGRERLRDGLLDALPRPRATAASSGAPTAATRQRRTPARSTSPTTTTVHQPARPDRAPAFGTIHVLNSLLRRTSTNYGVASTDGANVLIEGSVFCNVAPPVQTERQLRPRDDDPRFSGHGRLRRPRRTT